MQQQRLAEAYFLLFKTIKLNCLCTLQILWSVFWIYVCRVIADWEIRCEQKATWKSNNNNKRKKREWYFENWLNRFFCLLSKTFYSFWFSFVFAAYDIVSKVEQRGWSDHVYEWAYTGSMLAFLSLAMSFPSYLFFAIHFCAPLNRTENTFSCIFLLFDGYLFCVLLKRIWHGTDMAVHNQFSEIYIKRTYERASIVYTDKMVKAVKCLFRFSDSIKCKREKAFIWIWHDQRYI